MSTILERMAVGYVGPCRELLAGLWTDDTAHPDYRPLPSDMSEAYGQCVGSSCAVFGDALVRFPEECMVLEGGRVLDTSGGVLVDHHLWKRWYPHGFPRGVVIDTTLDQAVGRTLPPYIVATDDAL